MKNIFAKHFGFRLISAGMAVILCACAGMAPVPGGGEKINESCFRSEDNFRTYLSALSPGMAEEDVLAGLCCQKESLIRLNRRDIMTALLGDATAPLAGDQELIRRLYGYKLDYRNVRRKHGFSSPIRIQTNETGYSYSVTLIFLEGRLFEEPILSGGVVNNSSSRTLFDYMTPGTIIEYAN